MTQANARIICDSCGKQYKWKPEIAGRKVKCGCGQVMQISHEPPPAPDDLYDVVDDGGGATAKKAAVEAVPAGSGHACPSCGAAMAAGAVLCVECGYDTRRGARLSAEAPAAAPQASGTPAADAAPPWIYRRKGLSPEEKVELKPSPLRDCVLPLVLIPVGVILCFYAEMHRTDPVQTAVHAAPVAIGGMISSIALMLGGMFLAAAIGGVAFSDKVPVTILKICAVALAPGAVAAIIDPMIGGINGNIIGNLAAVGLYWGLFALLFRLPAQDTVICVMIVWIIRVGVAYGMYKLNEFRGNSWI